MDFSIEEFKQLKEEMETWYAEIGKVYCPYFQEEIHFNRKGIEHLIFKDWNKIRLVDDQFIRFRHLKVVPEIIKSSRTVQGILLVRQFERVKKKDGKWQQILKMTAYYEFIAVMESHGSRIRAKVIIKQIEGGEKFFLSIIPFWGSDKLTGERILHSGNPRID